MNSFTRPMAVLASLLVAMTSARAAADYGGPDGYGNMGTSAVVRDGYLRDEPAVEAADLTNYVIIEAEEGTTEEVEGETVIVVQEPEPIAATSEAPPAPRTVVVEQPAFLCPGGIWVDGYWAYSYGQYVWVDGHCVVERVNYVFVHPRWDFYANVWWFVPGYYRPCGVFVGFGYFRPWHWFPPHHQPFYRTGRPVPVHRTAPVRPTTVRTAPVGRPARASTVRRVDASPTRTSTARRVDASPTRTGTVTRQPTRVAGQRAVVDRPPSSVSRTAPAGRSGSVLTSTAPRARPQGTIVTQPRAGTVSRSAISRPGVSRTGTVSRVGSSSRSSVRGSARPGSSGGRTGTVGRPSSGTSRGSSIGRSSFGSSRSSFGRSGGFSRPSSGGFGGARSVPAARGR
ncbi:MAG TPA: hypothetical protein VLS88_13415 [Polyangiales bacterium]|nr:hypothetical protein [Polyangiales bacterium]